LSNPSGSRYVDNMNVEVVATAPPGNVVKLTFMAFDTEADFDYVTVYEGPFASGTPLGKFSGQVTPAPVSSVSNQMTVVFTTDTSLTKSGVEFYFDCGVFGAATTCGACAAGTYNSLVTGTVGCTACTVGTYNRSLLAQSAAPPASRAPTTRSLLAQAAVPRALLGRTTS
jgi:hypothetical protein